MKKHFGVGVIAAVAVVLSVASCDRSADGLQELASFEGGTLHRTAGTEGGWFRVAVLGGTWRQMGRQYGYLLRDRMTAMYDIIVTQSLIQEEGVSYAALASAAETLYAQQSTCMQELISGMAETSGFTLEKQKMVCSAIHLGSVVAGCSSMAAWGEYTGGGPLVVGRNWDLGGFDEMREHLGVVVYNPSDSDVAVAEVGFLGILSFQTGLNSSGIFLDLQNGQHSDLAKVTTRRLPTYVLFEHFLNSRTLDQLGEELLAPANLPQIGLILNAADSESDRVYELATYAGEERRGTGLIASANHFISPAWTGLPVLPDGVHGDYSRERLDNLLAFGERYKGTFDAERMMEVYDVLYPDGGATFDEYTVYQVVAVPAERTIWLKGRTYSGWERIDLGPLFEKH